MWKLYNVQISMSINQVILATLIHLLSLDAVTQWWQSWIAAIEMVWPAESQIFTLWSSAAKVCWHLFYVTGFASVEKMQIGFYCCYWKALLLLRGSRQVTCEEQGNMKRRVSPGEASEEGVSSFSSGLRLRMSPSVGGWRGKKPRK